MYILATTISEKNISEGTCITIGCDNNVYGPACKRSCGNCLNRKDCYHINGSCLSGCKAGYKGEKCMDGKCIHNYISVRPESAMVCAKLRWYVDDTDAEVR